MRRKLYIFMLGIITSFFLLIPGLFAVESTDDGCVPKLAPMPENAYKQSSIISENELKGPGNVDRENYINPLPSGISRTDIPATTDVREIKADDDQMALWGLETFPIETATYPSLAKGEDNDILYWAATVEEDGYDYPFIRIYKSDNQGASWQYLCGVSHPPYVLDHPDLTVTETRIIMVCETEASEGSIISASWELDGSDFNSAYVASGGYAKSHAMFRRYRLF